MPKTMVTKKTIYTAHVTGKIVLISKKEESFVVKDVANEAEALIKFIKEIQGKLPRFDLATEGLKVILTPNGNHRKKNKPPYLNNANGRRRR